jgi:hypothetical protein
VRETSESEQPATKKVFCECEELRGAGKAVACKTPAVLASDAHDTVGAPVGNACARAGATGRDAGGPGREQSETESATVSSFAQMVSKDVGEE